MSREIDHVVYCVPDLNEGVEYIENLFGVKPVIGGAHLTKGTKNALLNLGNTCYLEILAIDHDNVDFMGSRWMGIDMIQEPKITRWSLKSNRLQSDSKILSQYSPDLGIIDNGSRKTMDGLLLSWEMILPASTPEVELLPFMTDWSESEMHPTDSLAQRCFLQNIELYHPDPSMYQPVLSDLAIDIDIKKSDLPGIAINVNTPSGPKRLS